jgi:malate dehydrogenase (oxaloacetate-decarboxylating)(NADP+)
MFDTKGLIHKERKDLNKYKADYAIDNIYKDLSEALTGADVFVGLSSADLLTPDMIKLMAKDPIVFAMANPDPEIKYDVAKAAREDVLMATGRSDYPNQVNNVLGFPFIFRGALDVRATVINEEMKMAAVKALARLAKEKVPDVVISAYGGKDFSFGREYIIPKPFDPRVLWNVAPAVAKAAIDSGVARVMITDWKEYEEHLKERLGYSQELIRVITHKAMQNTKKIVFPEGEEEKIIRAAHIIAGDNIGKPVLLGNEEIIKKKMVELKYNPEEIEIRDPRTCTKREKFAEEFFRNRQRKGITKKEANKLLHQRIYYGSMMVAANEADALVGGLTTHYPQTIKPALQCVGVKNKGDLVCGLYIVILKRRVLFFADTTVNIDPNAEELAKIAITTAETVKSFEIEPRIAMLSFSNFGSVNHPESNKVREALQIIKTERPDLIVDGEMQADTAVVPKIAEEEFPFSLIKGDANVLIFPNLSAGNIAYKLFERLTDATVIGPILMGMRKSIHVLQRGASVDDIVNISAIAAVESLRNK